jgi:hypothetical protein
VLEVAVGASGATVSHLTIATWDHLPSQLVYALHWAGTNGVYRQVFFNRMQEATFPPFSAPVTSPLPPRPSPVTKAGLPFGRPLSVISGGGAFYDFNLDFGCCFGTVRPDPSVPVPADTASSGEVRLQLPAYRTVLVNGTSAGVRFYPLNGEQVRCLAGSTHACSTHTCSRHAPRMHAPRTQAPRTHPSLARLVGVST